MKNRLNERRKQAHILMFSILKILSIFYKKLVHFDLNYLTNSPSNFERETSTQLHVKD